MSNTELKTFYIGDLKNGEFFKLRDEETLMQFIKVDHQSRPKGHGSCLCLEYGENAITERWLMGDGRWAVKVDVNSIDSLIKAFENKRAPQDNWIPIEDKSKLEGYKPYLIQLKPHLKKFDEDDCVRYMIYRDHEELGSPEFYLDDNSWADLEDVLYYQPLPEAKT